MQEDSWEDRGCDCCCCCRLDDDDDDDVYM